MCTLIADASSKDNNILDPATNLEPFRLDPPLRPGSPTGALHHPPIALMSSALNNSVQRCKKLLLKIMAMLDPAPSHLGSSIILPLSTQTTSFLTTKKILLMMTSFPC